MSSSSSHTNDVLKSLKDCYNFESNDDNNQQMGTNGSHRRRPVPTVPKTISGSARKPTTGRTATKAKRCPQFQRVIDGAVWLNDVRADSPDQTDAVLALISRHLLDGCLCVSTAVTHIVMANTHFERSLLNIKQFETKVADRDTLPTVTDSQKSSDDCVINDIPVHKDSKLEANVMLDLVDTRTASSLVAPMDEAVDHWSRALQLDAKTSVLSEELVMGFKIYYNLSSVIHINNFYKRFEASLKAAKLLDQFCRYYSKKYSEMALIANYYLIKTYIQLGAVRKATTTLTVLRPASASSGDQLMPESLGTSLNLLAKCELDLLNGRTEKAAKALQMFLESDYLQKLTINRYYVKGLALLMSTRFPSKYFNYSNNFKEFLEPIQMSICILKRWHPWLSSTYKPNNENQMINAGDLDPIWYKFAVMTFAFDTVLVATNFYINIEIPIDSLYYYNSLIKLGRRYCATARLSELLLIGSQLDVICDHKYSASIKLSNALLCLQSTRLSLDSTPVFKSDSSVSPVSPKRNQSIDISSSVGQQTMPSESDMDIKLTECPNDMNVSVDEGCEHNQVLNPWDVKRRFKNIESLDLGDSEDFSLNTNKKSTLKALIDENESQEYIDSVFLSIEIDFYNILLNEKDVKKALKQIQTIHIPCLERYASDVLKPRVEKLIGDNDCSQLLDNYPTYRALKFKLIEKMARLEVDMKQFENAVNTCQQMSGYSSITYNERTLQSNLLYLEAFSKFGLYLDKHNICADKLWIEFNSTSIDYTEPLSSDSGQLLTPTKQQKFKSVAPKAPKQKAFKNDEINDYVTALTSKMYDKSISSGQTSKSVFPAKSIFENDSEMRSLSVSDMNSTVNEKAIDPDIQVVEVFSKSRPNIKPTQIPKRITRSMVNVKDNVENKTKASRKKSSKDKAVLKSVSSVEMDLNTNCDDLDEVFHQKLVISDEIKAIKKFSKDDSFDLLSIISLLKFVFRLTSSHPLCKLDVCVHKLLTQIYSTDELLNDDIAGYHYCQTNDSNYRYRHLFIAEKKRKLSRIQKYDLNSITFNSPIIGSNNSHKVFTDSLPNDWRIIQLSVVNTDSKIPELMVCRYQKNQKPVFLKLKAEPQRVIKHFMTHFVEIIERSNASIVNKDKETFWRLRYSLDEELMILLRSVEETWFGAFRGILMGQINNKAYRNMCKTSVDTFIYLTKSDGLSCKSKPLLEVLVESLPSLKYNEYKTAMKTLFATVSDDIIGKCFANYEKLFYDFFPIDNKELVFTTYGLSPVGLILDKSLEAFPFESLPSYQTYNQSLFRTPSLRVLSLMYNTFKDNIYSKGMDESSVYYVINPADNLDKTQEYFKSSFLAMKEWNGVIGRVPPPAELKEAFDSKDTYIFFGHGAGASYYRTIPEGLDGCLINCASIVMGCSSGKLFADGKHLQSYGTPYRFMMNGSPCYVGVLWDVTDKDIDKFSDYLLSYCFSNWKPEQNTAKSEPNMSISSAVSKARKVCRLKHLIGAAPVVYGLPLFARTQAN